MLQVHETGRGKTVEELIPLQKDTQWDRGDAVPFNNCNLLYKKVAHHMFLKSGYVSTTTLSNMTKHLLF